MNTTPEEKRSIHRMSEAEYKATFVPPMRRVEEEEEIVAVDLTAYAAECLNALGLFAITVDDLEIPYVWLSADSRFTHVPLFYGEHNAYLVIIIDNLAHTIPGYFPLNINAKYGIIP